MGRFEGCKNVGEEELKEANDPRVGEEALPLAQLLNEPGAFASATFSWEFKRSRIGSEALGENPPIGPQPSSRSSSSSSFCLLFFEDSSLSGGLFFYFIFSHSLLFPKNKKRSQKNTYVDISLGLENEATSLGDMSASGLGFVAARGCFILLLICFLFQIQLAKDEEEDTQTIKKQKISVIFYITNTFLS